MVFSRALKPGDFVLDAGSEGTISEVGMLARSIHRETRRVVC
ncbi:hypothetical protein [Defluviicoccus vanus]